MKEDGKWSEKGVGSKGRKWLVNGCVGFSEWRDIQFRAQSDVFCFLSPGMRQVLWGYKLR